jgi:hypothetical protein
VSTGEDSEEYVPTYCDGPHHEEEGGCPNCVVHDPEKGMDVRRGQLDGREPYPTWRLEKDGKFWTEGLCRN